MKSEFPETKLTKFGKKFGWIFSPILFLSLLIFTFFTAQNLTVDPFRADIVRYGYVHLKELADSEVYFDGVNVGTTSTVLRTTKVDPNQSLEIKVLRENRRDWNKIVRPREGFVSILFPILYPQNLSFSNTEIQAIEFYKSENRRIFFYERFEDGKVNLYRYQIQPLLFTLNINNTLFTDISEYVLIDNNGEQSLKERAILPGNQGNKIALVIPNERIIIFENNTVKIVQNYIPKSNDTYFWSPNDDYFIINSQNEILSFELNSSTVNVINRVSANENLETQFILENGIVFKKTSLNSIDLLENSFRGNNLITIEIPNIDRLRSNNLQKAYNLSLRQNEILLQSSKNIYKFNTSTFELLKFNTFEDEVIIYTDSINEVIITQNRQARNQFRYYNTDKNISRSFSLDETTDSDGNFESILGFNYSNNLAINFPSKIILSDSDGANRITLTNGTSEEIIIATKENRNVFLLRSRLISNTQDLNRYEFSTLRFEN